VPSDCNFSSFVSRVNCFTSVILVPVYINSYFLMLSSVCFAFAKASSTA
jgi:hypothetical protein